MSKYKMLVSSIDNEIAFADIEEAKDYFTSRYPDNYYDDIMRAIDLEDLAYMLNQINDVYDVIEI